MAMKCGPLEPEFGGYISGFALCSDVHQSPVNILYDININIIMTFLITICVWMGC